MSKELVEDIKKQEAIRAEKKARQEKIKQEYLGLIEALPEIVYGTPVTVVDGFYKGQAGKVTFKHNAAMYSVSLSDGSTFDVERIDFMSAADDRKQLNNIKKAREKFLNELG